MKMPKQITKIKKGERSRARVYNYIQRWPGSTTSDVSDAIGLSGTSVRRYVASLVREGYVKSEEVVTKVLGFKGDYLLKRTFRYTALADRLYAPRTERMNEPSAFLQLLILQVLHHNGPSTMPELEESTPGSECDGFQLALAELMKHGFVLPRNGRFTISEVGDAV